MSKIMKLNLNSQFKKLYSSGKSCVRPSLVLYVKRNGLNYNRLGITVGKKLGKAVVRNRAKRRLRELFRANLGVLKTGFDFVLVARMRTVNIDFSKLYSDFYSALAETGVLKND